MPCCWLACVCLCFGFVLHSSSYFYVVWKIICSSYVGFVWIFLSTGECKQISKQASNNDLNVESEVHWDCVCYTNNRRKHSIYAQHSTYIHTSNESDAIIQWNIDWNRIVILDCTKYTLASWLLAIQNHVGFKSASKQMWRTIFLRPVWKRQRQQKVLHGTRMKKSEKKKQHERSEIKTKP